MHEAFQCITQILIPKSSQIHVKAFCVYPEIKIYPCLVSSAAGNIPPSISTCSDRMRNWSCNSLRILSVLGHIGGALLYWSNAVTICELSSFSALHTTIKRYSEKTKQNKTKQHNQSGINAWYIGPLHRAWPVWFRPELRYSVQQVVDGQ